jgi:quercetin dioxygenase-like cupin family protein
MQARLIRGRLEEAPRSPGEDEWVLVLEGRARLRVEESELELRAGEWLLLPAGCPHTVLETEPGTNWLAVHLRRDDQG